ncbi:MAG: protein-disulfide reductase DsbD [Thiohalomonadales bacterium]
MMLYKKFLSIITLFIITILNLVFLTGSVIADSDEILPYKEAYKFTAVAKDENTISASWKIIDKHLMYQDKFKFTSETPGIELGTPILPTSETKEGVRPDGTMGPIQIYKHQVTIDIPIKRIDPNITEIKLVAFSQGCNDRICYPPNKQRITITLPKASLTQNKSSGLKAIQNLSTSLGLGSAASNEMMTAEQAFQFSSEISNNTIITRWKVAEGTYLYKKNFKFVSNNPNVQIGKIIYPKAYNKNDPLFGDVEVYQHDVELTVPLIFNKVTTSDTKIKISYQGCSETLGICYPPTNKEVFIPAGSATSSNAGLNTTTQAAANSTTESVISHVGLKDFITYVLLAFVIGLGLTFTPCVLPMLPILSSIIIGQGGKQLSKTKGGILATIYVLGTSVVYVIAGWIAGESGDQLQAYFQIPWVITTFAILLFLLALSMFGLYSIQIPSFIQSRMQEKSASMKGGTYVGVFIMGVLSSLIVGACASPLLLSVLGIAMTTHDPVLGAAIMFGMSMGMGVLLVAFGIGASALVPKAGSWMDDVKYGFGVLLIAVAIYLLQAVPAAPVLYLWATLFIITAVYMRATQALPDGASGWKVLAKGFATVLLVWGVLALLGGMLGGRDILNPIPAKTFAPVVTQVSNSSASKTISHESLFTRINNLNELDAKLTEAKQAGKPVVIDFYADWCQECLKMEKSTFSQPDVVRLLSNDFIALQVDVTDQYNLDTKAIMKRYGIFAPPAILFFNNKAQLLEDLKLYGFKSTDDFIALLNKVKLR